MPARAILFVLILAMPVVGFGAGTAMQRHLDSLLREAAHKQVPDATEAQLAAVTATGVCASTSTADLQELCDLDSFLSSVR
jgi:hypothetical protein